MLAMALRQRPSQRPAPATDRRHRERSARAASSADLPPRVERVAQCDSIEYSRSPPTGKPARQPGDPHAAARRAAAGCRSRSPRLRCAGWWRASPRAPRRPATRSQQQVDPQLRPDRRPRAATAGRPAPGNGPGSRSRDPRPGPPTAPPPRRGAPHRAGDRCRRHSARPRSRLPHSGQGCTRSATVRSVAARRAGRSGGCWRR